MRSRATEKESNVTNLQARNCFQTLFVTSLRLAVIAVTHFPFLISYRRQKRSGNVKITVTKSSVHENAFGRRFRFFSDKKKQMSKRTASREITCCASCYFLSPRQRDDGTEEGRGSGKKLSVAMKCLFNFTEKMTHVRNVLQGEARKNSIWKLLSMAFLHYLNEISASAHSCSFWSSTVMSDDKCLWPEEVPGAVKLNANCFEQHN